MKPGDKYPVNLNEHIVAEAVVIDIEDGKVTLDIPATRIVMGVKSSLTDLPDEVPNKDRILLGDDRENQSTPQAPNATDAPTPTQVSAGTPDTSSDNAQGVVGGPVPVVQQPAPTSTNLPPDAIGDGLANVQLKEID